MTHLTKNLTDLALHALFAGFLAVGLFYSGAPAFTAIATAWLVFLAREQRDVAAKRQRAVAAERLFKKQMPGVKFVPPVHEWKPWTWSAHTHREHLAGLVGAWLAVAIVAPW